MCAWGEEDPIKGASLRGAPTEAVVVDEVDLVGDVWRRVHEIEPLGIRLYQRDGRDEAGPALGPQLATVVAPVCITPDLREARVLCGTEHECMDLAGRRKRTCQGAQAGSGKRRDRGKPGDERSTVHELGAEG